jgi:hypothetical protein
LKEMQRLNPKGPDEYEEERQEQEFLNGTDAPIDDAKPQSMSPRHKMD